MRPGILFSGALVAALMVFAAAPPACADHNAAARNDSAGLADCRSIKPDYLPKPAITIYKRSPSRGLMGTAEQEITGTVEGVCLIEAGYFEDGRKVADFPIVTQRDFRRFEFRARVNFSRHGELRAYNINGLREVLPILPDGEKSLPPADTTGTQVIQKKKGLQERPGVNPDGSFKDEMFFGH